MGEFVVNGRSEVRIDSMGASFLADLKDALSKVTEFQEDSGTATGGSNTTVVDTKKDWAVNMWALAGGTERCYVEVYSVANDKYYFAAIASNTATTITHGALGGAYAVIAGDTYAIRRSQKQVNIDEWGGTAITGRDVSGDLQALTDISITGLLKSIGDIGASDSLIARLGALADAVVAAGATGSMSAKLRRLTTDLNDLLTRTGEVQASPTENTILDRLKDIATAIALLPQLAATPVIYNKTMTNPNTEYSQVLPANTKKFLIHCRDGTAFRLAFVTGKVAAPTEPYLSITSNSSYNEDHIKATPTLYIASAGTGKIVEIVCWS